MPEKILREQAPNHSFAFYIKPQGEKLTREVTSKELGLILIRAPNVISPNVAPQYSQRFQEHLLPDLSFSPYHLQMAGVLPPPGGK